MNPYKAPRATFNAETGYPVGEGALRRPPVSISTDELATSSLVLTPLFDGGLSAYATLYFFVGRHTGLAIYLPAALFLRLRAPARRRPPASRRSPVSPGSRSSISSGCRRTSSVARPSSATATSSPPTPVCWWPCRVSRRAACCSTIWALAAVVGISALASQIRFGALDPTSQAHANAGLFRLLPYESTATNLDGRRDRYWANDFVRFVDPFAEVGEWSFTIAERPAGRGARDRDPLPRGADAPDGRRRRRAGHPGDLRLAGRAALPPRELRARPIRRHRRARGRRPPGAGTVSGGRPRRAMPRGWCASRR